MTLRSNWSVLSLALLAPVAAPAFVFVPQRATVEAKWSAPGLATSALASDYRGNLYAVQPGSVTGYAERDGAVATLTAGSGRRMERVIDIGQGVIVVERSVDAPSEVTLTCLAPPSRGSDPAPPARWTRNAAGVPPGGVQVVFEPNDEPLWSQVAVVGGSTLFLLDGSEGTLTRQFDIGQPVGPVSWAGEWGAVVSEQDGRQSIRAFRLAREPILRELPAPADDELISAALVPRAGALVAHGRRQTYTAPFVFVPERSPEPAEALRPVAGLGPRAVLVPSAGPDLLFAVDRRLALSGADGELRWQTELPAGVELDGQWQNAGGLIVPPLLVGAGGQASIVCLDPAREPAERWRQTAGRLAPGGVMVVAGERPMVAALSRAGLHLLDLRTGAELARRPLGRQTAPPLWVEDSLFVSLADHDGRPALLGFDLTRPEDLGRPPIWVWSPPAGETVERLEWLAAGRLLVVHTGSMSHVFE